MSKKDSDSALKNKVFLGFWFVLFAALILLVNWLFRMPVNKANDQINRLEEIDKQVTRLTALHAQYILSTDREDNLFTIDESATEKEVRQVINSINNTIRSLSDNKHFVKKASDQLNEFSSAVKTYEADLANMMLIVKERGNKSTGLVNKWLQLSSGFNNSADQKIQAKTEHIKVLESEYLLNRNTKSLEDILLTAQEIKSTEGDKIQTISGDLDTYITFTGNLISIEKRMGHNAGTGIIPDLERSLKRLPSAFTGLQSVAANHVHKIRLIWTISRYVMTLLIVALFIYLFLNVFSLVDPLRKIAFFTQKLSAGEFPDHDFAVGNLADMLIVKEGLKKHVSHLVDKFNFTRALNEDRLDEKLTLSGENDLLGRELTGLQQKIAESKRTQEKNEQDNLVRRYMNEGLAKFADLLRSKNNDINSLGDAFIREIVKYLNALQGGFFIYDDSERGNPVLTMISAFAYNRKKYLQQTVKLGEGLIGTCAREKQYMNFTEIPAGYITITSGLGDTPPNNLLLIPVMHENEILGVIEIASLYLFKQYEIDFAREVALSLGSTLVNTRNNQRTSELLTRSQQQALEMAEQEEEMRQNMEELKATQEESARREEELRGIAEAIGNSLMVVEYGLDGKISSANQKLCLFLGKEPDQIIGRTHQDIFGGTVSTENGFWKELQKNGLFKISETIHIGKNSFGILEHFVPVTNRNNVTVKYINFISDGRTGNS
jgi:PAS domain-containing protein